MEHIKSIVLDIDFFDGIEAVYKGMIEQFTESLQECFDQKRTINISCDHWNYSHRNGCEFEYVICIASLPIIKKFDTWLELVEWITNFKLIMRKF